MGRALGELRQFVEGSSADPAASWGPAARVFEKWGVKFAYLFGSRARGTAREDSDWDVAFYFGREVTALEESMLEEELASALGVEVDVVALDVAPLDLAYVVIRDGVPIYSRDEAERRRWEVETYLEYLDWAGE
ncbi:MAG: nucleotidyltransferase domain-containing protein [Pyrobaculum sp.]